MRTFAGTDDAPDGFPAVDTSSEQHLRETVWRAIRTRRGTIREFPDRYVDLAEYVQARAGSVSPGAVAGGIKEDLEQDERIERADVQIGTPGADGRIPFSITIQPVAGAVVRVEGTL